jgi:hypothetical protein
MKVKILNLNIPTNNNIQIIKLLTNHHWFLGHENHINHLLEIEKGINRGLTVMTYNAETNDLINLNTPLNVFANLIWQMTMDKINWKGELQRFFWNFYTTDNISSFHKDMRDNDFYSIIYNLHTTDGGTNINNKFYKDNESQVKIFNSTTLHKGIQPKQDKFRMNLNIVFKKLN